MSCTDSLRLWLGLQHDGQRNVYWSVNPTRVAMDKRLTKDDVAAIRFLHVDIDHRAGEDWVPEHERILALLTTRLPPGLPAPTIVIDSGGGFQAFWRLADPVPLDGLEAVDTLERYNRRLASVLGGDHCQNIDRIMRLPGTVNWPDERKRKKGRTPKLAKVAAPTDHARVYPLAEFTAEPKVVAAPPAPGGATVTEVQIPDAVRIGIPNPRSAGSALRRRYRGERRRERPGVDRPSIPSAGAPRPSPGTSAPSPTRPVLGHCAASV